MMKTGGTAMSNNRRIRPFGINSPLEKQLEWARCRQSKTGTVDKYQVRKLSVPSLFRWELSLADLEAERIFIRNHRGEYCHTGVAGYQFTDLDFV